MVEILERVEGSLQRQEGALVALQASCASLLEAIEQGGREAERARLAEAQMRRLGEQVSHLIEELGSARKELAQAKPKEAGDGSGG